MKKIITIVAIILATFTANAQTLTVNKTSAQAIAKTFKNGYFNIPIEGSTVIFSVDWTDRESFTADEDLNISSGYFTAKFSDTGYEELDKSLDRGINALIEDIHKDETKAALTFYYGFGLIVDKIEITDNGIKAYFYSTEI